MRASELGQPKCAARGIYDGLHAGEPRPNKQADVWPNGEAIQTRCSRIPEGDKGDKAVDVRWHRAEERELDSLAWRPKKLPPTRRRLTHRRKRGNRVRGDSRHQTAPIPVNRRSVCRSGVVVLR